jgi:hypothetical protein
MDSERVTEKAPQIPCCHVSVAGGAIHSRPTVQVKRLFPSASELMRCVPVRLHGQGRWKAP